MARDLSESPWRSAAVAPLFTPLAMVLVSFVKRVWNGEPIAPITNFWFGLDDLYMILVVWGIGYLYMWILAVPAMLLTRRWIEWTWIRLILLGALLAALP